MTSPSKIEWQRRQQAWLVWIDLHRNTLKSIGLPPEVYLDLDHWEDFLQNGALDWHAESSTGFEFSRLSQPQMRRLLEFLETNDEFSPDWCPMPGWLRVRLGMDTQP